LDATDLYWTNLYKVSFQSVGNPSVSLRKEIGQSSWKLLVAEIELVRPQRILFLTGQWWAEPFLRNSNFVGREQTGYKHVYQRGFWSCSDGNKAAVVVADHPERKKRGMIVSEILDAFSTLGREGSQDKFANRSPDAVQNSFE